MKKLLCILMMLVVNRPLVHAQTEKGNFLIGTQLGNLSLGTQQNSQTLSARLSPIGGYFVANRLAIGVGVPFYVNRIRYSSPGVVEGVYSLHQIAVTPFLRYYFNLGNTKLKPYVGASAGYLTTTIRRPAIPPSQPTREKRDDFTYGFQLGLAYFVSSRVSLDASMNFADGDDGINQSANYNPGLGISQARLLTYNVGFQLFFGK